MTLSGIGAAVGGLELFVFFTISGVIAAGWVYRDAQQRGADHPGLWGTVVGFLFLFYFVVGIAGLAVYLGLRGDLGPSIGADAVEDGTVPDPGN